MKLHLLFLFFAIALGLSSCDYSKMMNMGGADQVQSFQMPPEQQEQLSYAYVYQTVLYPKCTACHGSAGHVSLETYAETFASLAKIKDSVFNKGKMPKDDSLSQDQKAILWNWLHRGAPEFADPSAPPPPPPEPLSPTYDSIAKNIFQRQCLKCHGPTGHAGRKVPLDRASLLKPGNKIVIPGDPSQSELVISIERMDKKRMPPAKAGYAPLNDEEKAAIRQWIQNGAQD
jgi:mono/diheme cytochrome c family protein